MSRAASTAIAALLSFALNASAGDSGLVDIQKLKQELADMRRQLNAPIQGRSPADKALASHYGPPAEVSTRAGKLAVSGFTQIWYYSIQNDNRGLFDDAALSGVADSNEAQDNDSFRIRRTRLKFSVAINENISALISINPAREATSYPLPTSNQGLIKRSNQVALEFDAANGPGLGSASSIRGVQNGAGAKPEILRDAYVHFHSFVPHHDFTIGQYLPFFGEEGIRSSAQLDFAERSFVGQFGDARDAGLTAHGSWWDGRFQYWAGVHNSPGNYFLSAGQPHNRGDDNDEKDIALRVVMRPLWKKNRWGSLELGYSTSFGAKGESASDDPINGPINGLNRNSHWAIRHDAWASYSPGGPLKGLWLRGEWLWIKDRNEPGTVADLLAAGGTDIGNTGSGSGLAQSNGGVFHAQGWYGAAGYKISQSVFADSAPGWLKPFEFAFRYDVFENVQIADLVNPKHTDVFKTQVWTGGVNYYLRGHDAKIQLNYNVADEPERKNASHSFHEVHNNSLVVNFQVGF